MHNPKQECKGWARKRGTLFILVRKRSKEAKGKEKQREVTWLY
jgi:hypothetical protein